MTGQRHDVQAQVEAVLDVLAPWVDGPPGFATQRVPLILLEYSGQAVRPSDDQLRALAERIVTAVQRPAEDEVSP